jgi:hypothetical protein
VKNAAKRRATVNKGSRGSECPGLGDNWHLAPANARANRYARFNFAEKPNARCPDGIKQGACGLATGAKKTTESRS